MPELLLDMLFRAYQHTPTPETETAFCKELLRWSLSHARGDEDLALAFMEAALNRRSAITGVFSHWMAVTARNIRADRIRRLQSARRNGYEEIQLQDTHDSGLADEASALDLESLSAAEYQLACLLLEGYTLDEIAKAESVSASAVKMRLSRIRSDKKPRRM